MMQIGGCRLIVNKHRRRIQMRIIKRYLKQIGFSVVAIIVLFSSGVQLVAAQEVNNNFEDFIFCEYEEKKEDGLEVYALLDENGKFMGYYEPYSEVNPQPMKGQRYTANINWTISSGTYAYGDNQYTRSAGMKIQVNISQSRTGTSYLTFHNRTSNSSVRFTNTKVTNGWNGTLTLHGIDTAVYSFGIENASSNTITYSGSYSL